MSWNENFNVVFKCLEFYNFFFVLPTNWAGDLHMHPLFTKWCCQVPRCFSPISLLQLLRMTPQFGSETHVGIMTLNWQSLSHMSSKLWFVETSAQNYKKSPFLQNVDDPCKKVTEISNRLHSAFTPSDLRPQESFSNEVLTPSHGFCLLVGNFVPFCSLFSGVKTQRVSSS